MDAMRLVRAMALLIASSGLGCSNTLVWSDAAVPGTDDMESSDDAAAPGDAAARRDLQGVHGADMAHPATPDLTMTMAPDLTMTIAPDLTMPMAPDLTMPMAPDLTMTLAPDLTMSVIDMAVDGASSCGNGICDLQESSQTCPQDCLFNCGDVVVDLSQWLMWEVATSPYSNWNDGLTYCSQLMLDGYSWRMPGWSEQETVLLGCANDPNIGGDQCMTCAQSPACSILFPGDTGTYWNTNTYGTCCAGGADFFGGTVEIGYYKDGSGGPLLTRCVRTLTDCSMGQACLASENCIQGKCIPSKCGPTDAGR
jgi:hypothetical protein